MPSEPPPDSDETSLQRSSASSSQTAARVLCQEVGAAHPDGALKQIRTMKRLLRSHYRVKQRLERYGVDSLSDAVTRIAELNRQVREYREAERERAMDRIDVLDDLMGAVEAVRQRVNAQTEAGPPDSTASSSSRETAPPDAPLEEVQELIAALQEALDEIRLELWLHQSQNEGPSTPVASTAADLLDRLTDTVDAAQDVQNRIRAENKRLTSENETLKNDVTRLQQRIERKEARIEELERELEHRASSTDS